MGKKKGGAVREEEGAGVVAQQQKGGKSKKKGYLVDDDEYSVATEVSEESEVREEKVVNVGGGGGKKKGKKGNVREVDEDDDEEVVVPEFGGKKKGKKGKKSGGGSVFSMVNLDELEGEDGEKEDEDEEVEVSFAGRKKSSKGGKKGGVKSGFELLEEDEENGGNDDEEEDEEDEPVVKLTGKKKSSKGGKKGGVKSSFALLEEDEENDQDEEVESEVEEPVVSFTGKKKSSKGSKKGGSLFSVSAFDAVGDEDGDEPSSTITDGGDDDDEVAAISFSGKKKKSKSSKKSSGSAFDALDDDENLADEKQEDDEAVEPIVFAGKKKSSKTSKKGGNSFSAVLLDEDDHPEASSASRSVDNVPGISQEDDEVLTFTGKKKSSKKKSSSGFTAIADDDAVEIESKGTDVSASGAKVDDAKQNASAAPAGTSKNKKKKKKGGRTAEEEDDLDKILAELGEIPSVSKPEEPTPAPGPAPVPPPPSQDQKVNAQSQPSNSAEATGDKQGEEDGVAESAAAKKKKKKKEKEKEKKAAAAGASSAPTDVKGEVKSEAKKEVDKKLPKHVREMQEALAKRQEAEERKKREEEEKLRKEEEERKRQEEIERKNEEIKRLKKERERLKLEEKRKNGLLLSSKQKEEQRRLEAMRKQFLGNQDIVLPAAVERGPTKRPVYVNKKSKTHHAQSNGSRTSVEEQEKQPESAPDFAIIEAEKADEVDTMDAEETVGTAEIKDNDATGEVAVEEDVDDDWDAKSWEDADLKLQVKNAFEDEDADTETQAAEKTARAAVHDITPPSPGAKPASNASNVISSEATGKKSKKAELKKENSTSAANSEGNLRSPICCIMGHVDTGKTKLLDCIRGTKVQEGEAGGITQQIGATYFPAENIRERTRELKADAKLNVPGLLVIDTPGHESFSNLRSRGSGLCDIAILVVDIMHGLEPQTIESLNLLKMRKTEFIVALNKVDRLYGWKPCRNEPIVKALKKQSKDVVNEFNMRVTQIVTQFKEQALNTELYHKNKDWAETVNIVPTSAISGEGVPDLLLLLVQWTQRTMVEKLTFRDELECTVLEVKVVEGHGTTIDVVLVNGVLHEGDQIVVCGMQGPIVTTIRALLTPHPMKELRVKGAYLHHQKIKAAQGIKISAQGLEHAIAGTSLHVVGPDDDLEEIKSSAMEDMESVMSRIDKSGEGVYVQASTLGSLEALLEFLKTPAVNIPVSGIGIGPVHKKDVMKAGVMLEKRKEFAAILAFDVKVTPEAREYADEVGVKIFMADIIYHLFDQFKAYIDNIKEEKKREASDEAVFPCVLKIMPNCVFNKKDPIVLGVDVIDGICKVGTPICIPSRENIDIGRIASIENNHKAVDTAKKGQQVAIKIVGSNAEEQQKMFGRHFEIDDELVSHISRRSIDLLKANYRDDLTNEEWKLVVKLKNLFRIQ